MVMVIEFKLPKGITMQEYFDYIKYSNITYSTPIITK